jgi:2-acylglycerol O-acyltransferase 2
LYILPGGVAEIFVSTPGKHCIIFKKRRGVIKLALETGAEIVPSYVFGGTDFFDNFATTDSFLAKISRWMRAGVVVFYGKFGLPIPYTPRVTMVFGDPIKVPCYEGKEIPKDVLETYHAKYMEEIVKLFDKYKAAAGYPDSTLEIL